MLRLQQASLEEIMEKRFLVERTKTNQLIKNTLDVLLKSFNDFVLFNMNMLMQQRLPPTVQSPSPLLLKLPPSHPPPPPAES